MTVADEVQQLFGDALREPPGVLHVTAVWQGPGRGLVTLRIGPDSPASATDLFALGVARARCDAIVTTGRILREEPEVAHRLPEALGRWRREVRGLPAPPVSLVLTGRADLDLTHPLLATAAHAIVVTDRDAAGRLAARVREADLESRVEVVGRAAPSLRDAVRYLQWERQLPSVCIEAGPSSSLSLYAEPACVDELMLSVYDGPALPEPVRGGAFLSLERLHVLFEERHQHEVAEPSGSWRFLRLLRRGRRSGTGDPALSRAG